jgi:hypothetical protein
MAKRSKRVRKIRSVEGVKSPLGCDYFISLIKMTGLTRSGPAKGDLYDRNHFKNNAGCLGSGLIPGSEIEECTARCRKFGKKITKGCDLVMQGQTRRILGYVGIVILFTIIGYAFWGHYEEMHFPSFNLTLPQLEDRFNSLSGISSLAIMDTKMQTQKQGDGSLIFRDFITGDIMLLGDVNPSGNIRAVALTQDITNPQINAISDIASMIFLVDTVAFNGVRSGDATNVMGNLGLMSNTANLSTIDNRTAYNGIAFHVFNDRNDNLGSGDITLTIQNANDAFYK